MKMNRAFTLIELLIVVIIIATLASISLPQYFKVIERFRLVETITSITDIKKSEEMFKHRKNVYTDDFANLDVELKGKDGKVCEGKTCELRYFTLEIRLLSDNQYMVIAQRKSDETTRPPERYAPNYIYFYDSTTDQFNCTDANCVKDFID
jgi:prepilin-type N-terminal cleavage/methylation domain-containing protein